MLFEQHYYKFYSDLFILFIYYTVVDALSVIQ